MTAVKEATQLNNLLRDRWSPRAFSDEPVSRDDQRLLWEAARWAPSAMNEQPWSFVVADKYTDPAAHARIASTLVPQNAAWAERAPVLAVAVAHLTLSRNGVGNPHALYDTGQAVANLTFQATSLGLSIRQMGGFSPERAAEVLGIPAGYQPVAVLAIGHADVAAVPGPRVRRPVGDWVFQGDWGSPVAKAA